MSLWVANATLTLGSLKLGEIKDDIDPGLMWLSRPSDKRIERIDRRNREQLAKYVEEDYCSQHQRESVSQHLCEPQATMQTLPTGTTPLDELPWRLFLDSSTLQALYSYGEFIYDGGEIASSDRIWSVPNGPDNLVALQSIMQVGRRAPFELVLSEHSLKEVASRGNNSYLGWAYQIVQYWRRILVTHQEQEVSALSGQGDQLAQVLASPSFGYLSEKDKALLTDAVELQCEAFITLDQKLTRNAAHLENYVPIRVLKPTAYWQSLRPWARMLH